MNVYLRLNDSNEIEGFATFGTLDDGKEYTGDVPDDFETSFKPGWYKLIDGEIVVNSDYQEPTVNIPTGPSAEMQAINALGLVVAQMQAKEASSNV